MNERWLGAGGERRPARGVVIGGAGGRPRPGGGPHRADDPERPEEAGRALDGGGPGGERAGRAVVGLVRRARVVVMVRVGAGEARIACGGKRETGGAGRSRTLLEHVEWHEHPGFEDIDEQCGDPHEVRNPAHGSRA